MIAYYRCFECDVGEVVSLEQLFRSLAKLLPRGCWIGQQVNVIPAQVVNISRAPTSAFDNPDVDHSHSRGLYGTRKLDPESTVRIAGAENASRFFGCVSGAV